MLGVEQKMSSLAKKEKTLLMCKNLLEGNLDVIISYQCYTGKQVIKVSIDQTFVCVKD